MEHAACGGMERTVFSGASAAGRRRTHRRDRLSPVGAGVFRSDRDAAGAGARRAARILGQDPYHEPQQATGLAFSVGRGVRFPPSLRNIFTELESDLGIAPPENGDLTGWAEQGVLLLNTVLTVRAGQANSHAAWGWQRFTDAVIAATAALPQPVIYLLWGAQAQKKAALLTERTAPTCILSAPHPSPLSSYRGFFGSRPFSRANDFLTAHGSAAIDWGKFDSDRFL